MSSLFYKSIIEDEIKVFGIKQDSLKAAAKSVAMTYSRKSLTKGQTFLDYNIPSNRCAYLYKYASIHTGLVAKYFMKIIKKKEIKSSLKKKKTLKICCLGGGPGTDIVGLFKALAMIPHYHQKVIEVTVLDICGGWRNSFKRIIKGLLGGDVKGVSDTFVDSSNFRFKLITVNLLLNLPASVVTVIAEADIVCMVKFVSAILGSSTSVSALKVIGEKLKIGAVVLFIDNFQGNVFKPFADISGPVGLHTVLGPLHESFNNKTGYIKGSISTTEKEMYGCLPLFCTRVTVLGSVKLNEACTNDFSYLMYSVTENVVADDDDDGWDTDNEPESSVKQIQGTLEYMPKLFCDKFTQTEVEHFYQKSIPTNSHTLPVQNSELKSLIDSLCDLISVFGDWQKQMSIKKHCCNCH